MEPIFPANPEERVGFYGGRIAEGIWGEPLNVAVDVCLVLYLIFFFLKLRKDGFSDSGVSLLVLLGIMIGLGSIIFHGRPTRLTLQIDVIPISIFGLAYIIFSLRRFLNQTYVISAISTLIFLLCSTAFRTAIGKLSVFGIHHLPSILALIIMGSILNRYRQKSETGRKFFIAAGFYIAAIFFRMMDLAVFRSFPLGTHFLWHACTSGTLIVLLHTAAQHIKNETIVNPIVQGQ